MWVLQELLYCPLPLFCRPFSDYRPDLSLIHVVSLFLSLFDQLDHHIAVAPGAQCMSPRLQLAANCLCTARGSSDAACINQTLQVASGFSKIVNCLGIL